MILLPPFSSSSVTFLLFICLLYVTIVVEGCTVFIAGRKATIDGSTLVSHSNDGEFDTDPRLVKIPSQDWPTNSNRPVFFSPESYPRYVGNARGSNITEYLPKPNTNQTDFIPIGYIPQIPHTYAYLEETYGAINEHGLGIGESTCSGIFGAIPLGAPNGTALFSIDALTQIAMERTTTARDAIKLMGSLAEQHGFYGAGEFEGTAESLGVTDSSEAWIFHILPDPTGKSAIWAAQKIPPQGFAVLANMFVIRKVDPTDTENFLMSDSVHDVAKQYKWWTSQETDGLLDFTKIYSDGEYAHKYYSGRRMWGGYHLACPSQNYSAEYTDLQSDPVYPVWCLPDHKISLQDIFRYHRYTYQNTTFDLGAPGNIAGGPFGSPDRWKAGPNENSFGGKGNWERPIGLYRTSDTYVVQSTKSSPGASSSSSSTLWFGPASALATIFTPFVVDLNDIPTSFRSGHHSIFSRQTAFWAACVAHNVANLKWNYAIKDITNLQNELESSSIKMVQQQQQQQQQEERLMREGGNFSTAALQIQREEAYVTNAETVVRKLWELSDLILFKYASGFVNEPDSLGQMVGYPKWWLQAVGYQDGPPPPPTKPKCCHPPPGGQGGPDTATRSAEAETTPSGSSALSGEPLTGKAAMKKFLQSLS